MPGPTSHARQGRPKTRHFATTRWSLVVTAGAQKSPKSQEALAVLCGTYWYPLYAYVRRRGYAVADAQDLTQAFFAVVLEKGYLKAADRRRGRFRSFLLTALKRFLSKEWDRAHAKKRGGRQGPISLDFASGESRYGLEPSHDLTPEAIYDRRWALTVLEQVMARLRSEYAGAEKARLFDRLKVVLTGERGAPPYSEIADGLGMTEGAIKVAVHRLRRRYREALRAEIAQTVADPNEVKDEMASLLAALGGKEP